MTPDQQNTTTRIERSLNQLTTNFIKYFKESENGEVDLRHAVEKLGCKHKRRIYDITNVLQGIGLVQKKSKNVVKWIGDDKGIILNSAKREKELKAELEDLSRKEFVLDQQKSLAMKSIEATIEESPSLYYVNQEDIGRCFTGHTLLAVRAPTDTQTVIPIPKAVQHCPPKYQIHMKSMIGPIEVTLVGKESSSSDLVVFPVPPFEEFTQEDRFSMSASCGIIINRGSCRVSPYIRYSSKSDWKRIKDSWLQQRPWDDTKVSRSLQSTLHDLEEQLDEMKQEVKNSTVFQKQMASDVCSPLQHLSPYLLDHNYIHSSEDTCDLFDTLPLHPGMNHLPHHNNCQTLLT